MQYACESACNADAAVLSRSAAQQARQKSPFSTSPALRARVETAACYRRAPCHPQPKQPRGASRAKTLEKRRCEQRPRGGSVAPFLPRPLCCCAPSKLVRCRAYSFTDGLARQPGSALLIQQRRNTTCGSAPSATIIEQRHCRGPATRCDQSGEGFLRRSPPLPLCQFPSVYNEVSTRTAPSRLVSTGDGRNGLGSDRQQGFQPNMAPGLHRRSGGAAQPHIALVRPSSRLEVHGEGWR